VKRLFVLLVPTLAVATSFATANAQPTAADAKRSVCHRTKSTKRPYVKLNVSAAQLRAHGRHAADIVPAPGGACPGTLLTPTSGGTAFQVSMTGEAEGSPAGDPVGTGTTTIRMRRGQGQVCFRISVQNITLPSAGAHIHSGAAGSSGPIVVQLRAPGASGTSSGCTSVARTLVARILSNPSLYYTNVHTTDFPAGAVRGQLTGTNAEMLGIVKTVQLTGAAECNAGVCNLGDPDGTGTAVLRIRHHEGLVCYRIRVQNIVLPSVGAHIHRGASNTAGPIVVPFTAPGASGVSSGCTAVAQALLDDIVANPSAFYVNVHSTEKPAGAVRAQLS